MGAIGNDWELGDETGIWGSKPGAEGMNRGFSQLNSPGPALIPPASPRAAHQYRLWPNKIQSQISADLAELNQHCDLNH